MKIRTFLKRFSKNEDGGPATEAALLVALVAAIAGFGMVALGDSLAAFFTDVGENLQGPNSIPNQSDSTFLGGSG